MTTTTAKKRLEEIETYLTPKEQAIKLADEMRKYPDALACMKALVKLPLRELPVQRPFYAFERQAAEQHPGDEPEDIRARNRRTHELWREFHKLKLLMRDVNRAMQEKIERIALQVALRLSALHALILQDAFAHTATNAAAFTEAGIGEPPPGSVFFQFAAPSPLTEWSQETTALLKDFFAHLAVVELVQAENLDGHPILYPELEAELTEATRIIESAVATARDYLNRRAGRDGAGAGESPLAIAFETIKADAKGQQATAIAEKWMHDAKREAVGSDEEPWERFRQEFGASKPAQIGNG
jgi:hypothetical protein